MVYKVNKPSSLSLVRQAFRKKQEYTRPELSAETGLSLVTVGKAVKSLLEAGELHEGGKADSGGGRPVQRYRYNANYAQHALIQATRQGQLLHVTLELVNLQGVHRASRQGDFAYLEAGSFDGWLDHAQRRHRLQSITICLPHAMKRKGFLEHLGCRYPCPVQAPTPASILSHGETDGTATLYLPPGGVPSCSLRHNGSLLESGLLHLLPLPARWESLDYTDHTLLEEVAARLLHIVTCTLAPARIVLYAPPLGTRLMERIRFNSSTKLHGRLPPLDFRLCTPSTLPDATLAYVRQLP